MSIGVLDTTIDKFTHIVHLADIHIRLTKRHDEYQSVFKRLYEEIKKTPTSTLICLVGDIVHSKLDLSPECVQEAKDFLHALADIRPTILVPGNHDANLSNKSRLDSLSPIVDAIKHKNLFYLKASGLYAIGNICINNYSIFDDDEKYIKGQDIPSVYRNKYEYFLALFHGPVNNALTDIGYAISSDLHTVNMFDGHDLALLGDIHMKQDLQYYDDSVSKPYVHYCGSLIQQNHGESLLNHGFSLWDLQSRSYDHVEIPNDYGFFTVKLNKGVLETDLSDIPKKTRLRIQCFETIATEVKSNLTKIRLTTDVVDIIYVRLDSPGDTSKTVIANNAFTIGDLCNIDNQNKLITDYLKDKLNITDQSIIDAVLIINKETNGKIQKDDIARNIRWKPKAFEWDNMFSYGEDNRLDFSNMKDVIGLFSSNASGKSSIFSALSFCIFDKCEREFKASEILNVQKMKFKCKFNFEINGTDFFIERGGEADKKGNVKVEVKFWKEENGNKVDLNGEGRRSTNDVIREYVGTYEDFILTALSVSQNGKSVNSFIDMGNTERKDLLAQFMGLTIFDRLFNIASNKLKDLSVELKDYKKDDFTKKLVETTNQLLQSESKFNEENEELLKLSEKENEFQKIIAETSTNTIKLERNIPPLTLSEQKYNSTKRTIEQLLSEIEDIKKYISSIDTELNQMESELNKMGELNISETYKTWQDLCKKRNELQSKIETKKLSVRHKLDIINKVKTHEFNPDCEFCVKNADVMVKDAADAHQQLKSDKEEADTLLSTLNDIKNNIESISWVEKVNETYNKLMEKINKHKNAKITNTDKSIRLEKSLKESEELLVQYQDLIDLYKQNESAIENNKKVEGDLSKLRLDLKNIQVTIKNKNQSILDLNGKICVCKNTIDIIKTKIQNAKKVESEYAVYESYINSVCRDGIPYEIISNTVPKIEKEINDILSQIVEFSSKIEMDGKNVIPYIDYEGKKWPMTLSSGFERFVLSLAIRVALINVSSLPRPNFLVVDEGFGAVDAINMPSMQTLFSYLKTHFDFIIIVSHIDALRDVVDKHIEIKKDNGFSKVNFV